MTEKRLKPNKAHDKEWEIEEIRDHYPVIASPKIDGERILIVDGEVRSSSLKYPKNEFIKRELGAIASTGMDGEITIGDPTDFEARRSTRSGVGRIKGEPDFHYHVFDDWSRDVPYHDWYLNHASRLVPDHPSISLVPQIVIEDEEQLLRTEKHYLGLGFEGLIIRSPHHMYKFGRNSMNQFKKHPGGGMLKVKRFRDDEAWVTGCQPLMRNLNEAKKNELGHTERSSAKGGKVPDWDFVGMLLVKDYKTGVEFGIGSGWDRAQAKEMMQWHNDEQLVGKLLTYKHFPHGAKDAPNLPIFKSWRSPDDMTDH